MSIAKLYRNVPVARALATPGISTAAAPPVYHHTPSLHGIPALKVYDEKGKHDMEKQRTIYGEVSLYIQTLGERSRY